MNADDLSSGRSRASASDIALAAAPRAAPTGSGDAGRSRSLGLAAWLPALAIAVLAFAIYSSSFHSFPVIDRRHSVLADADAANFVVVVRDFDLGEKLGDPYNERNRSVGDIAQKHKIHHVLYGMVGHALYRVLSPVYGAFGHPDRRALYVVNAVIAAANLLLLSMLLRRVNPNRNAVAPFLLFYAAALSTWIFSSIPESWPFSATLVIAFLYLLSSGRASPLALGLVLGVFLLNNIFLAALMLPVALRIGADARDGRWIPRVFSTGIVAVATWAAGLTALSVFDGTLRPDRFVHFTLWFRRFADPGGLPLSDPYVWKSAFSNLYVTSVVSNQGDPSVPQEALRLTLEQSVLGTVATTLYLAVAGLVMVRLAAVLGRSVRAGALLETIRGDASLPVAAFGATMLLVTVVLYYASGFLYSTIVVPTIAVSFCRFLDLSRRPEKILLYSMLLILVVNNAIQVRRFQEALGALS